MAEVVLNGTGVHSFRREVVAARVAEHVRVNREREFCQPPGAGNDLSDGGGRESAAARTQEDER